MNTPEKYEEGFLSNWLFKRNKDTRKAYADSFGSYKESKLEDLAELYTISKMIDSIQGGQLKLMCGDNLRYKIKSLRRDLGQAPSYEINQVKHILRLVRTGGVIEKFEELCQGETYDKYAAAGRSITNFLGAYIEYERNNTQDSEPEEEETIEPKPIPENARTFKTFIVICTLLEKQGLTPAKLSSYFDRSKSYEQNNSTAGVFTEIVNGLGYIPEDVYIFITSALMDLYEDEFRKTALSPEFFNYIKNAGYIDSKLEQGSPILHKNVLKFFIIKYAGELPNKPQRYQSLWQSFLARTNGLTKTDFSVIPAIPDTDPTLVDVFDSVFRGARLDPAIDPAIAAKLDNIKLFIRKYIEISI